MNKYLFLMLCFCITVQASSENRISPFKYDGSPQAYTPPASSIFHAPRSDETQPDIQYYISTPDINHFPILMLIGGSSTRENIMSMIHLHRYFMNETLSAGCGLITAEQIGVSFDGVDTDQFFKNYTRTQRYRDHHDLIEHLKANPPEGWNGQLILLGGSEGGHIAVRLMEELGEEVIATILWSSASDHDWETEVWAFLQKIEMPEGTKTNLPKTREELRAEFESCLEDPSSESECIGMTKMYMADALQYPLPNYKKHKGKKILVVTGAKDSLISSSDAFVYHSLEAGANLTYHRIEGMDHYIRKRPDIYEKTFEWIRAIRMDKKVIE